MVSVQIAALVVALSGAGDTVLLDFHASWCAPCRSMDGTIAELQRAGYPVQKVDTDRQRALADRYRVQTIPCFVLLVDGKEAGRITGATRRRELLALFAKAGIGPRGARGGVARAQSPDDPAAAGALATLKDHKPLTQLRTPAASGGDVDDRPAAPGASAASPQSLIQASVRLKIEDPKGASYGSGTIIDARQGEALVLTCGHIFREAQGKGRILVDLLGPQAPAQLPGRLVAYDLETDIGLVSIRPGVNVKVAPVAPPGQRIAAGDRVITVGCNNGGPPTAIHSQITSIDKFLGSPNLQVSGLPVEGRSGGGLFTADGLVIGVCNAADPADNQGLYAALASIHGQLDRAGLTAVYAARPAADEASPSPTVLGAMSGTLPRPAMAAGEAPQLEGTGAPAAALDDSERAALAELEARHDSAEVICIVRSLDDPRAKSEVIMLDHASADFLKQLSADRRAQEARHLTSHAVGAKRASSAVGPDAVRWSSSSTAPTHRTWR
jgi:thiol-disulfide isomerase/thioredoxin